MDDVRGDVDAAVRGHPRLVARVNVFVAGRQGVPRQQSGARSLRDGAAAAVPLPALDFEALPAFALPVALSPFPAFAALPVFTACVLLAELAVSRLDKALDVAGAVGTTAGAPAEPLSDAVLRRAGRAGPEDVTMGFLREARVY